MSTTFFVVVSASRVPVADQRLIGTGDLEHDGGELLDGVQRLPADVVGLSGEKLSEMFASVRTQSARYVDVRWWPRYTVHGIALRAQ